MKQPNWDQQTPYTIPYEQPSQLENEKLKSRIDDFSQIRQTFAIEHKLKRTVINYSHLAVIIHSNHNFANSCFANIHDMTGWVS